MRVKFGLLILILMVGFALFVNFLIIEKLEDDSRTKLESSMIHEFQAYERGRMATVESRLRPAREFAREEKLLAALLLPADTDQAAEDRHFEVFTKLESISRLKYPANQVIITDADGAELARTQTGKWYKERWADKYKLIRQVIDTGDEGEDIWMMKDRVSIASAVPVRFEDRLIGVLIVGNAIDEELARMEKSIGGSDYAFYSREHIIASTLTSVRQAYLNDYVSKNSEKIAKVLLSRGDYFKENVILGDEEYSVLLSPMPSMQDQTLAGFAMMRSVSHHLKPYSDMRTFLVVVTALFILLGIPLALLILQEAYRTIDFILEGAHQIIVGNKDYSFTSNDPNLVGIGQAMNLMIAILLGKYIPEDEDEINQMALKGGSAPGPRTRVIAARAAAESLPIESMAEGEIKSTKVDEDRESYFQRLFTEFIAAKKKVGDDISLVTKDRLVQKLLRTEEKLCEKHGVKAVRFEVHVENNKVTLKPFPIKDE